MANKQEQALPVLHPVTDYEKIKRVGEGTYGVVCKSKHFAEVTVSGIKHAISVPA